MRATTKLVIYTLVGSLLMLAAAVATGVLAAQQHGTELTFSLAALASCHSPTGSQNWIFLCFAAAFLVKMPAFPLHGWLPDGYRAMPLPALAVFSGVAVEGRGVRLPARSCCRSSRRRRCTSRSCCC